MGSPGEVNYLWASVYETLLYVQSVCFQKNPEIMVEVTSLEKRLHLERNMLSLELYCSFESMFRKCEELVLNQTHPSLEWWRVKKWNWVSKCDSHPISPFSSIIRWEQTNNHLRSCSVKLKTSMPYDYAIQFINSWYI